VAYFSTLGKTRVTARVRPENEISQKVARKIGLQPERFTVFAGFSHILFAAGNPAE
jgi:RimJ/RimL family protein N-acetyltransferase